jgi:hypothetical protein
MRIRAIAPPITTSKELIWCEPIVKSAYVSSCGSIAMDKAVNAATAITMMMAKYFTALRRIQLCYLLHVARVPRKNTASLAMNRETVHRQSCFLASDVQRASSAADPE